MKRISLLVIVMVLSIGVLPLQARRYSHSYHRPQSVNLKVGLFQPNMNSDLWDINMENLALIEQDMQEVYYAVEYELFFTPNLSLSLEAGNYEKEHYSQYKDYEYSNGDPIYQNLALRITSVEIGMKLYPLSYRYAFNPYVGLGLGIHGWQYEQWGDFIDFTDMTVEEGYSDTSAYTLGFNARAGFLARIWRSYGFSFE
ncbi:MAG: hypothetical protein L0Y73_04045, partial [Candidatus Aminicenantes bacterium]|nr:hypothetical protein [Candidatus Aminicenantes bacterium]